MRLYSKMWSYIFYKKVLYPLTVYVFRSFPECTFWFFCCFDLSSVILIYINSQVSILVFIHKFQCLACLCRLNGNFCIYYVRYISFYFHKSLERIGKPNQNKTKLLFTFCCQGDKFSLFFVHFYSTRILHPLHFMFY